MRPKVSSSASFRARVRMYRHGLGDCILLSFPRTDGGLSHVLIDCGVLNGTEGAPAAMKAVMRDVEQTTLDSNGKGRLDLVIATHEHWDHLSGFHQAREIFDRLDIGEVWMAWTEDPQDRTANRLRRARSNVAGLVARAVASPFNRAPALEAVDAMLDDFVGPGAAPKATTAAALDYLRDRADRGRRVRYLKPGEGAFQMASAVGVKAYVLGPPRSEALLGQSEVTEKMKEEGIVFGAAAVPEARLGLSAAASALDAALSAVSAQGAGDDDDLFHPFSKEHRITKTSAFYAGVARYHEVTYESPDNSWRTIEDDWLTSIGQLALKLDNDTNNTSLVLALELGESGDVLLFPGDAQIGNWKSWKDVKFEYEGKPLAVNAADLLRRTVFYKVGHHGSHNATIKKGGLDLMERDGLVAFIPVDKATAAKQGRIDQETNQPRGWAMPAKGLYDALVQRCGKRVVLSDAATEVPEEAERAGVTSTPLYIQIEL